MSDPNQKVQKDKIFIFSYFIFSSLHNYLVRLKSYQFALGKTKSNDKKSERA